MPGPPGPPPGPATALPIAPPNNRQHTPIERTEYRTHAPGAVWIFLGAIFIVFLFRDTLKTYKLKLQ
jgi:hypothetical protein